MPAPLRSAAAWALPGLVHVMVGHPLSLAGQPPYHPPAQRPLPPFPAFARRTRPKSGWPNPPRSSLQTCSGCSSARRTGASANSSDRRISPRSTSRQGRGWRRGPACRAVHAAMLGCGMRMLGTCWSACGQNRHQICSARGGCPTSGADGPRPGTSSPDAGGAHGDCGAEQAGSIQGPLGAQKGLPIVRRRRRMKLAREIVRRACRRSSTGGCCLPRGCWRTPLPPLALADPSVRV